MRLKEFAHGFDLSMAGRAEEIRADLAAFERIDKDALRPTPINQKEMPARTGAAPALTASTFA